MTDKAFSHMCKCYNEQAEEIKRLQSDLEMFMNLCDKKDEWLEAQRNEIAVLKAEIENEYYKSFFEP